MVYPPPRILTVNKSAEREARLREARFPAVKRRFLHVLKRAVFLSISLPVMAVLFPWLLDTSRSVSLVPRSFLPSNQQSALVIQESQEVREASLSVSVEYGDSATGTEAIDTQAAVTESVEISEAEDISSLEPSPVSETSPVVLEAEDENSPFLKPRPTENTFQLTEVIEDSAVKSQFAVLIDAQTGEILAERNSDTLMNPASMTKTLSLLTAVEALTGPDGSWDLDSVTANTKEIAEYCWVNDCSMAWFSVGERVPIRDTLYGMILPSGADAALMLANYTAGSQEAFVERMNARARELGLSDGAHFENCVGLYGQTHVCTARDMAIIMKAAMDHPVCRTVLGKEVWQTVSTEEHPGGILLLNRFLRRIKSQDAVLTVIGAKTGYVRQAGNCAVSMARRADGREYICVTAKGPGSMQTVRDHAALYRLFCGGE